MEEEGVARLASLRAEVGAFLGSEVLTHVGRVGGEGEHPWHHFGSWVVGAEELELKSEAVRFGCRGSESLGTVLNTIFTLLSSLFL